MDKQYRQRVEEIGREMIRSGEFDNLVNPDRDTRLHRNNQDDWSLSYSIRDIPTFDGKGDSLPHTHIMEFGDFLANTGSEIRYLPQESQADDREHHMAVVKDVVSKFKVSLKGKPRLWFEMQYPTSADEPKTKEAYEKMIASFITEHNTIGSTREQQIMAWKTLNWNPVQERLDDFVYRLRRIGQELGKTADEQLHYFKCSVPQHLYLYHKDATMIKEAMENIKRACALGGVPVVAPVDTRTTQSVPFMQMTDSQGSRNVPRNSDDVKISGFQFQGKIDYLDDCVTKIVEMFEKNNKRLIEEIKGSSDKNDSRSSRDNRDSRDSRSRDSSRRGYRSDSDSSSEDDRYRSRSRDESRSRSRSRGRLGKPCTYCHKPNHDFSHCYKLARELRKLCTGEKRNKGDKEEEARLNMLLCVKNYFESEKDSTN